MKEWPGYKLVITGHSLGAGTAGLVGMLLIDGMLCNSWLVTWVDFPDLVVYGYGTPKCVSESLAARSERFMHSFVVGIDVIPRLSMLSLYHLGQRCLNLAARNRQETKQLFTGLGARIKKGLKGLFGSGRESAHMMPHSGLSVQILSASRISYDG